MYEKIAIWECWVVSTIALPTLALRKCSRCYWETRSNVKGQHVPTRNNQRQKYMKETHLFLQILAVIGRYGPHLMIVMIFVTQNNFKWSRNFRPSPWILPKIFITFFSSPCFREEGAAMWAAHSSTSVAVGDGGHDQAAHAPAHADWHPHRHQTRPQVQPSIPRRRHHVSAPHRDHSVWRRYPGAREHCYSYETVSVAPNVLDFCFVFVYDSVCVRVCLCVCVSGFVLFFFFLL